MKAALYTLGCKQNYAESSSIADQLVRSGYQVIPFDEPADVVIINTCTVTETADRECRRVVRRALQTSPSAVVVVTGCYAQLEPDQVASIDGVRLVVGNADKHNIARLIERAIQSDTPQVIRVEDLRTADLDFVPAVFSDQDSRTRAFLKLQDGCDYSCTFCTIPHARGKSRSMPFADIPHHVRRLVNAGYREIVLTGINLGEYRAPSGERLLDVLRLLVRMNQNCRYRLSSVEPNRLHPEIIAFISEHPTICPHFHLPLQSGSPEILRAMRRRYKRELYAERLTQIKELMPSACIGADVLTGFPGETDKHFEETYRFIESLPISYLHVFTYSERDLTEAARRADRIPLRVRKERTHHLRMLSELKRHSFYASNVGTQRTVLVESYDASIGAWVGYTENYCRVALPSALEGEFASVTIDRLEGTLLWSDSQSFCSQSVRYLALPVVAEDSQT